MKKKYVKPLALSIMILLAVGYWFSVRVFLIEMLKWGKEQAYKDIRASVLEHAQNDLFWNFTGTPTPLDELWPPK
jgi:hypothetical protein